MGVPVGYRGSRWDTMGYRGSRWDTEGPDGIWGVPMGCGVSQWEMWVPMVCGVSLSWMWASPVGFRVSQ